MKAPASRRSLDCFAPEHLEWKCSLNFVRMVFTCSAYGEMTASLECQFGIGYRVDMTCGAAYSLFEYLDGTWGLREYISVLFVKHCAERCGYCFRSSIR